MKLDYQIQLYHLTTMWSWKSQPFYSGGVAEIISIDFCKVPGTEQALSKHMGRMNGNY